MFFQVIRIKRRFNILIHENIISYSDLFIFGYVSFELYA